MLLIPMSAFGRPAAGSDGAMPRRKRQFFVAVVDDDAAVREATENLLNSAGIRTRGAHKEDGI